MPKIHLRLPAVTYSTCRPFTRNKERIQKCKVTEYSQYTYQNGLDKVCFQDMACGDFKDLPRRTVSGKVFGEKSKIWWISTQTCFNGL